MLTYAHVVHIMDDGVTTEVHRLEFPEGDESWRHWRLHKNYISTAVQQYLSPIVANTFEDPDLAPVPNTWVTYVPGPDEKLPIQEYRLRLSDIQMLDWFQALEKMPRPLEQSMGSGRRPNKVQRLTSWKERQRNVW